MTSRPGQPEGKTKGNGNFEGGNTPVHWESGGEAGSKVGDKAGDNRNLEGDKSNGNHFLGR